jgi:thioredoxin-related protein
MNMLKKIAGWSVAAALVCSAQAAEWCTDFAAALKRADAENKLVLADFTGSDWCYYCIRLRADVLDNPRFAAWAESHFVLLEIDLPENPAFDQAKLKQNRELCARYGVDSYPTVLVLSDTGEPLGGFFGYVSDPAAVQKELAAALRVASLLRQARRATGEARLRPMLKAWKLIPEDMREFCPKLAAEVAAVDTRDESGLRAAAAAEQKLQECRAAADAAPTDTAALQIVDAALAQAVPQNRRQLLEMKYRLMVRCVETHADVLAAAEVAYASIDADLRLSPRVKESRKRQMQGVFANPQTTINRSRMLLRKRPAR